MQDLQNADCVIVCGSNMAEAHPVGFNWVMEARRRGAKTFHIDPRFTRTSASVDRYIAIRAGSDIAFLGGVVNYVLSNERDMRPYVLAYTNASHLVSKDFRDTEDLDGLFSGFDTETNTYDTATWALTDERDPSLQHSRSVYQVLKRHYARYTPEAVERICGISQVDFLDLAETWCANSGTDRTTALCYSVGWTQHSVGVQYIRTATIIQLLLGNIGRPGGGILALRGHASIQGSTDIPTLFDMLPGYLPMPHVDKHPDLSTYVADVCSRGGGWLAAESFIVSLLKAWFGDAASAENSYCYDYLPKLTGDHSTYAAVQRMLDGDMCGYFLVGENPAVGSAHSKSQRLGMANLDWLVVRDFSLIESATWWYDSTEVESGEIVPSECRTEVFFFPAAAHTEKSGTFTNTQRMLQWHEKAVEPKGDARSELHFYYYLGKRIREKLAGSEDPRDRPILDLTWDYPTVGAHDEPSADAILAEVNGSESSAGASGDRPISGFAELKADGSTSCGCWIYSGVFADGVNQAARRKPASEQDTVAAEWGWAWPGNRRLLYNRASADPQGQAWSERKSYMKWDADAKAWSGPDVADFDATRPPDENGLPFTMLGDGVAHLFASGGLVDGPLPVHYEPVESSFKNLLYERQDNPTRIVPEHADNPINPGPDAAGASVFPFVFTGGRLTEHHGAGGMSRIVPELVRLQPEFFVEVSPDLADLRGLEHLGWAHMVTERSAIEARVLVTSRMRPLEVDGETMHQISAPYHWGRSGLTTGDSLNDLFPVALDPNVFIPESKVGTCDIQPGRRPRGAALVAYVEQYRRRAGVSEKEQ